MNFKYNYNLRARNWYKWFKLTSNENLFIKYAWDTKMDAGTQTLCWQLK